MSGEGRLEVFCKDSALKLWKEVGETTNVVVIEMAGD